MAGLESASQAGDFKTTAKWKNCDTKRSGIAVKATFPTPASYDGSGRYMVKKWVEWEYLKTKDEWREVDPPVHGDQLAQITNTDYDFVSTIGGATNWHNLYDSGWRAKVTFKLIKNGTGPRDKQVTRSRSSRARAPSARRGTYSGTGRLDVSSPVDKSFQFLCAGIVCRAELPTRHPDDVRVRLTRA